MLHEGKSHSVSINPTEHAKLQGGIIDEIEKGFLWLGNKATASNVDLLQQLGITHVVCVLDVPFNPMSTCTYFNVPLQDDRTVSIKEYFVPTTEFIVAAKENQGKV